MRGHIDWTHAQDEALRKMYCDGGMSAREIAEALPGPTRTRNSVIGRIHRLFLSKARTKAKIELPAPVEPVAETMAEPVAETMAEPDAPSWRCRTPACRGVRQPARHLCAECISQLIVPRIKTVNRGAALRF